MDHLPKHKEKYIAQTEKMINQAEAVGLEVRVCRDEHQQASPQVMWRYIFVFVVVYSYFCLRSIKYADVLSEQVMIILPYYQRIYNLEADIISLIFNSVINEFCVFLDISRWT